MSTPSLDKELKLLKRVLQTVNRLEELEKSIPESGLIKTPSERGNLKEKLKNYIWKIENNTLEVAFVGLEKAGKSTFANAFIGNLILPSERKRATYIPTQVRYSKEPRVEVYFYTYGEFLKVFRSMLREVKFPDWAKVTLESLTPAKFKNFFESLRETDRDTYDRHKNRLEKDILEILEGKREILNLLKEYGGSKKTFSEEEKEQFKPFITDPHKSRAVKQVVIYSSRLKGLENVIIYDLPGFDSPTFTHVDYTVDFLKKADAIVFVREADKPSLKGPEVDVLTRTKEEDGVPIKEKLFFFFINIVSR